MRRCKRSCLWLKPGLCLAVFLAAALSAQAPQPAAGLVNVKDFGAKGDGVTLDTAALTRAIDTCARAGGGTVYFPAGTYLSGTLHLKSHVTLWIDSGATVLGSNNLADYASSGPQAQTANPGGPPGSLRLDG